MKTTGGAPGTLTNKKSIQLLTTIALIGICLYIILIVVLHFLPTGYDPLRRPTSEYAVGKYGLFMTIAFFGMSVGSFALVAGLYLGISKRPKLGLILLCVWTIGVLVAMIFPIDLDGDPSTTHGAIHRTNGPIIFMSLTIGTILVSLGFRRDVNWNYLHRRALLLSIVMLIIFISVIVSFASGLGYEGILQRLYLITFSAWFIMVDLHLRRIS
jgi:hypothetical protein